MTAAALALLGCIAGCAPHHRAAWDARAAAKYLDQREAWWAGWSRSQRDANTFCVSCHTALPYALVRPALAQQLHERAPVSAERQLLEDVSRRVALWQTIRPYYGDKAVASRGTEAVLNALILANRDAHQPRLGADTEAAFRDLWALQASNGPDAGSWPWIQFNNEPWEAPDSRYYGAALAAMAVGLAPAEYRARPDVQTALGALRGYLTRELAAQT
ncbi:MAG: hypothetical protein ACREUG_05030, partial [Steroidobacteraceae bacterium]